MIPITRLSVGQAEGDAAAETVASGWLAQGKRVERFEQLVADYVGARHAIATNSATSGLHLALLAAGVQPGDEVICPSYSFIATANSILYAGATPVFVDIDPRTYTIDVSQIEQAITPRTKAILPVSQIGLAADLPAIVEMARRRHLKVVEDAAPSLGAIVNGRHVGSISDFSVFSFDPRKVLTTGEGGMITTDDDDAATHLRALRAHSASVSMLARHTSSSVVFESYPELGYNYKMTDIQGAIGIVQMGRIHEMLAARRRLASRYEERLAGDSRLELPYEPPAYVHAYQSYCVRLKGGLPRLTVMNAMAAREIATRRITAIHLEPFYRKRFPDTVLPETERANEQSFLVPMFAGLTDAEQDAVVEALLAGLDLAAHQSAAATESAEA